MPDEKIAWMKTFFYNLTLIGLIIVIADQFYTAH